MVKKLKSGGRSRNRPEIATEVDRPKAAANSPPRPRTEERRTYAGQRMVREADGQVILYGIHALEAALRNPAREIDRLLLTANARHRLATALAARNLDPEPADPREIDRLAGDDAVHQGACLLTRELPAVSIDALDPAGLAANPLVVILDQVTDPHNVGAILRSAAAFGAAAVVMTDRNSPPLAGVVAKAASGALDLVPVALVTNLARALGELQQLGYHVLGLDGDATDRLDHVVEGKRGLGPHVIVLGAEEQGLRRLTREGCDRLVCLATGGPIRSLNVSNAAAVALSTIRLAQARVVPESSATP